MYLNYLSSIYSLGFVRWWTAEFRASPRCNPKSLVYLGSDATAFHINFPFLSNCRDFHEHFQLEPSSNCDIKAEKGFTLFKFRKRRKGTTE